MPQPEAELNLIDTQIDATIVDVYSSVTLTQKFVNPNGRIIPQMVYLFGMVPDSAVYAFEMIRQNGTRVIGLAKAKDVARRELETARAAGLTAALAEEQMKDVFSIELANIGANETITVKISYIAHLSDDEQSRQLLFTIPRTYMQRQFASSKSANGFDREDAPFTVNVKVQQAMTIQNVDFMPGYKVTNH